MIDLLLVEDDESSRLAITEYLGSNGIALHAVGDGGKAIAAGQHHRPRVLLCDWLLPDGMLGLDVARSLHTTLPDLAVVFMTGLPVDEIRRQVGDLPISAMLSKPAGLEEIHSVVTGALGRPGQREAG